jgi:hypothetical protein
MERNVGYVEQIALDTAGSTLQTTQLFFKKLQPVLYLQDFFDCEYDSREFQKVIANGFRNIETSVAENCAQPRDIGCGLPRKVHEFHGNLL